MTDIIPFPTTRRPITPMAQAPAADLLADCCRLLAGFQINDLARNATACRIFDRMEADDQYDLKMCLLPLIRAIENGNSNG